jgi:DNA-binding LacI/PurR family transcriptional regulator
MLTDSLEYAFTDQYATDMMAAVSAELAPTGLALTLLTAVSPSESLPARDVPLDGAMVLACSDSSESIDWLRRRKLPMVFVDQEPSPDVTCVNIDETGGARAAAEHVVELGHTRIAVVTTHLSQPPGPMPIEALDDATRTTRTRTMGWIDALAEHGIVPVVVNAVRPNEATGAALAEQLLDTDGERPTAILCFSDTIANGVLRTARRLGIDVPGELSVVGFDDMRLSVTTTPPLTTVHQDVEGKGRTAVALLKQLIDNKAADEVLEPVHVVLPTHLVVRGSTGPVLAATKR